MFLPLVAILAAQASLRSAQTSAASRAAMPGRRRPAPVPQASPSADGSVQEAQDHQAKARASVRALALNEALAQEAKRR